MGLLCMFLADREARWTIYAGVAILGLILIMIAPAKQRLLTAIFIMSFQVDVYLRFYFGRSMNQEGFAFPLVVIAGAALLAWYASAGRLRQFRWAGSMAMPILALFATTIVSLLTSSERFIGLSQLWSRLELYFLYWLALNLCQSQEDFKRILKLLFFTLAAQSIIYFIQSSLGISFDLTGNTIEQGAIPRPGGTVSTNPAGFASFIMPPLLIAVAMVMTKETFFPRRYILLVMVLGIAAIGMTFTRAAWIGFALGAVTIFILGYRRRVIRGGMFLWLVAIAVVAGAILLPTMMTRIAGDYAGGSSNVATWEERFGLMQVAMNVIAENPILGIGPGAYSQVFKGFVPSGMDQWLFTVHNEFLLRAAESGIPGAIAFIALLVVGFRVASRLGRTTPSFISISALGWSGALVALIWQMNCVPWTGWSYNAMLWFMLGLMDGAQRLTDQAETAHNHQQSTIMILKTAVEIHE